MYCLHIRGNWQSRAGALICDIFRRIPKIVQTFSLTNTIFIKDRNIPNTMAIEQSIMVAEIIDMVPLECVTQSPYLSVNIEDNTEKIGDT